MTLSETPSSLKQFRKTAWKFQHTFQTPLNSLQVFAASIAAAIQKLHGGCLTIDQVVFEPTHLIGLLTSHSIKPQYGRGWSLTATGEQEVVALLQAGFSDSIDFIFIPEPRPFGVYADHDEYTTFYAHTRSNLNRVVEPLLGHGFKMVRDYERRF